MQLKHPSALSSFEQIVGQAKNKTVAMFLDYDGVLSPIVDDPDWALMSDDVSRQHICLCKCPSCTFTYVEPYKLLFRCVKL